MRGFAAWLMLLNVIAPGRADGDEEATDTAVRQVVERSANRFAEAFTRGDAAQIASLFTAEAEYVDSAGIVFHGRSVIEREFAAAFEVNPPGTMAIELISIRPIADGLLAEDGVSSFTPKEDGPTSRTRYTATHVKQPDGSWLIASVRELDAGKLTPHDRLQDLAWLVGRWHEDVGGNVIASEWKWSADENFLVSEFSVTPSSGVGRTGTHRVGWDAERKQFRSWVFESGGGATSGWWRQNADGSWSVSLRGVDAEGVRRSSRLTYARDGDNAVVVSHDQRIVDGESLLGSAHRVVRQPPAVKPSPRRQ